jgi:hypothetical protein
MVDIFYVKIMLKHLQKCGYITLRKIASLLKKNKQRIINQKIQNFGSRRYMSLHRTRV